MVLFDTLWANHPANLSPPSIQPCLDKNGAPGFENQCAIRLSICLDSSGVSLKSFRGACCWHGHGRLHFLRAEEMANWLNTTGFGKAEVKKRKGKVSVSSNDYLGRKGIVFFMNFWGPGNSADHIDLWDGVSMAHGDASYFGRSEQVWYWKAD